MKKLQLSIKALLLTSILFISCSEKEAVVEEICDGDNYKIQIDRLLTKLTTIHPGYLPTIKNNEYSYDNYNLLVEKYEYTFDYDVYRIFTYCNNIINKVSNKKNSLSYDIKHDAIGRITSYATNSSYLHNYTLTYNENRVTVSGLVNTNANVTIVLETNSAGLVTKISRENSYSTFNYDENGNLIRAKDFDNANTLLKDYEVTYDSNPNPYYGQLKSIYLERFIDYFSESAFQGIDTFFRFDQFTFPYLKNNPTLLEDKKCTPCYNILLKRTYEYDSQNYPIKMEESYVGAPAVVYEYQYN